jgi:hypothetical protein
MRMGMRRFTRLSNGFSKKAENLVHAVSLHFMYYNFAKVHQSLALLPQWKLELRIIFGQFKILQSYRISQPERLISDNLLILLLDE